ncbi:hypothetical protein C21_03769 [Arenibacter sp. NBRC 103722]|nr:hypothetical protein [Arenibacter sp. A80]RFT55257.1 hypothetical protein D0S24_14660 [Arenibacter sp. P308M17]GBF21583.1 hypothetical protein C21_03769 [Arenibacter sp. NBRC 103722]
MVVKINNFQLLAMSYKMGFHIDFIQNFRFLSITLKSLTELQILHSMKFSKSIGLTSKVPRSALIRNRSFYQYKFPFSNCHKNSLS